LQVVETIEALRTGRRELRGRVGAVYTMGALHDGHIALVNAARSDNDSLVTTIFVNPTQFGANEDFTAYPRSIERDLALFEAAGVDLVFMPTPAIMYPNGFQTTIHIERASQGLEGDRRPQHFDGVATVVAKLFNLTQPNKTYFGQKDAQQVVVVRRMARDLDFPLEVIVCPTVREADGLALSSRNVYLEPHERVAASCLYRALSTAAAEYGAGERNPEKLLNAAQSILDAEPLAQTDYLSLNHPQTLQPVTQPTEQPMLMSLTVQIGKPHLLDNALLPFALNTQTGLTATLGT
jgi:pantoate--beta-alanine ligase